MNNAEEKLNPPALKIAFSDIYPLDETYAARGEMAPIPDRIDPAEMPERYHSLLVNKNDLTQTLQNHYSDTIHIDLLSRDLRENEYAREVVLALDKNNRRVAFDGIKIFLDAFPAEARREILAERLSLGRILHRHNIPFVIRPRAYLRVTSDKFLSAALDIQWPQLLYGRNISVVDTQERILAEILELLPP